MIHVSLLSELPLITVFLLAFIFLGIFFRDSLKGAELVPPFAASIMAKFKHLLWKGV